MKLWIQLRKNRRGVAFRFGNKMTGEYLKIISHAAGWFITDIIDNYPRSSVNEIVGFTCSRCAFRQLYLFKILVYNKTVRLELSFQEVGEDFLWTIQPIQGKSQIEILSIPFM